MYRRIQRATRHHPVHPPLTHPPTHPPTTYRPTHYRSTAVQQWSSTYSSKPVVLHSSTGVQHRSAAQECSSTYGSSKPVPGKGPTPTSQNNEPTHETIDQPASHHLVHPPPTHDRPTSPLQQYSSAAAGTAVYRYARSIWLVLEDLGRGKKRRKVRSFLRTPTISGGDLKERASRHHLAPTAHQAPTDLPTSALQQQCSSTCRPIPNGSTQHTAHSTQHTARSPQCSSSTRVGCVWGVYSVFVHGRSRMTIASRIHGARRVFTN